MDLKEFVKRIRNTKKWQTIEYLESVRYIIVKTQETGATTLEEILEAIDDIIQETRESI